MREFLLTPMLLCCVLSPNVFAVQSELTSSNLPQFLMDFDKSLTALDQAYADLDHEKLPLLDESGQPLGRRHIKDRRKSLADLRDTIRKVEKSPEDLVLTAEMLAQTEALSDDLYDLSQIAYDNDREELGERLTGLLAAIDEKQEQMVSYALKLAADKQKEIQVLRKENRQLRARLEDAGTQARRKPATR